MMYDMTSKGQFENLTLGQGTLPKWVMMHIIRWALTRQIDCKWLDVSICSQSPAIAKKLQMTSDDVIMAPGDLAQVTGENLHLGYHVWPDGPYL